jgi:hypothetical protein
MLFFDGLQDALMGTSDTWMPDGSKAMRAVYSGEKMIEVFMAQGMTEDEAVEWISFNVEGAYVGEQTPIVYWPYDPELDDA